LGISGYGLEPSKAMISQALELHPHLKDRIFEGFLPESISNLPVRNFDGILLSAVLMHVPEEELFQSAVTLRSLLTINGKLVVSIPVERGDMAAGTDRDLADRLMILRPLNRVQLLFERLGFSVTGRWESSDAFMREHIRWATLIFEYKGSVLSESVDRIEAIINRDRKTATYKLALLRALCDIAGKETNSARWDSDGSVHIPIDSIARKWIEYYWPVLGYDKFIPQTNGEHENYKKPLAFRHALTQLIGLYNNHGGLTQFIFDRDREKLSQEGGELYRETTGLEKNASIKGPVYYAGGGKSGEKQFAYNAREKSLVLSGEIWREFVLLGHWIGDSIVFRWAELSSAMSKGLIGVHELLQILLLKPETEREIHEADKVFSAEAELTCVWSGKSITSRYAVDHGIPFSLRHDNSVWNLFPIDPKVNNSKSDKLPSEVLLQKRKDAIIHTWELLHENISSRFETDYCRFSGKDHFDKASWKNTLYRTFYETVETTAARRGVERWP
ncbi:MAG: hypothetical protein E4H36_12665, partial [Spirochaetales bacterium]